MKFAVPSSDFKSDYIDFVVQLNKDSTNSREIDEIYLSPPFSTNLHVRHLESDNSNWDDFRNFVIYANQKGISINAVLNAPNIIIERNKIIEYLSVLVDYGVRYITVSNPEILNIIESEKIRLRTIISTVSGINSVASFKHWISFNPSRIVLNCDLNRNISELKEIIKVSKIELETIVNLDCIRNCSLSTFHYLYSSNKPHHKSTNVYRDFCSRVRLENLVEYIKSPWILPEHCDFYDNIGINKFKIAGREFFSNELKKLVNFYISGESPSNISELFRPERKLAFTNNEKKLFIDIKRDSFLDEKFINFFLAGKCNLKCEKCNFCDKYIKAIELRGNMNIAEVLYKLD